MRVMTSLSVSLPRTVSDARQAISDQRGQVSSVAGRVVSLGTQFKQLEDCAAPLSHWQLVRSVHHDTIRSVYV